MEDPEVPMEQVHEHIEHHAHEAKEPWVALVALSTAILAALAAVCSLLAGDHANEAMICQIQSSDQWNFYQAKGIKAGQLKSRMEILKALGHAPEKADEQKMVEYAQQQDEIKKEADAKQEEAASHLRQHIDLARGVTMFQIAIAIGAISVLTKRRAFWMLSLAFGALGILFLVQGLLAH